MIKRKSLLNNVKNRFLPIPESSQLGYEHEPKISDFISIKELGCGSFGRVILAKHKITKVSYAIKIINKANKMNCEGKPYFRREVEIMHKVHHPNVVRLFGHFEDDNNCYFLMEYVSNGNLYNMISRSKGKGIEPKKVARIMKDIISAVYYLHNMTPPIIHRDIKPENALISEDNSVKLTDFGWSNYIEDTGERNTFCGTPIYLAPEMIKGTGHDERIDIWCMGCLMFELLTGSPPFQGKNKELLMINILKINISWPKNIDVDGKDLICKMLKNEPSKRINLDKILEHKFFTKFCNANCDNNCNVDDDGDEVFNVNNALIKPRNSKDYVYVVCRNENISVNKSINNKNKKINGCNSNNNNNCANGNDERDISPSTCSKLLLEKINNNNNTNLKINVRDINRNASKDNIVKKDDKKNINSIVKKAILYKTKTESNILCSKLTDLNIDEINNKNDNDIENKLAESERINLKTENIINNVYSNIQNNYPSTEEKNVIFKKKITHRNNSNNNEIKNINVGTIDEGKNKKGKKLFASKSNNNFLKLDKEKLKKDFERLRVAYKTLKNNNKDNIKKLEEANKKIENYEKNNSILLKEISDKNDDIKLYTNKISELENVISTSNSTMNTLPSSQFDNKSSKFIIELENELAEKNKIIEELKNQVKKLLLLNKENNDYNNIDRINNSDINKIKNDKNNNVNKINDANNYNNNSNNEDEEDIVKQINSDDDENNDDMLIKELDKKNNDDMLIKDDILIKELDKKNNDDMLIKELDKKNNDDDMLIKELDKKTNDDLLIKELDKKNNYDMLIKKLDKKNNDDILIKELDKKNNDNKQDIDIEKEIVFDDSEIKKYKSEIARLNLKIRTGVSRERKNCSRVINKYENIITIQENENIKLKKKIKSLEDKLSILSTYFSILKK